MGRFETAALLATVLDLTACKPEEPAAPQAPIAAEAMQTLQYCSDSQFDQLPCAVEGPEDVVALVQLAQTAIYQGALPKDLNITNHTPVPSGEPSRDPENVTIDLGNSVCGFDVPNTITINKVDFDKKNSGESRHVTPLKEGYMVEAIRDCGAVNPSEAKERLWATIALNENPTRELYLGLEQGLQNWGIQEGFKRQEINTPR